MWFVWMLAMGFAGPPEGVSAVAAPHGVQAQYDAFRDQKGLPAQSLACTPLWPEQVALCFKVIDGQKRRWEVAEDLSQLRPEVD